MLVMLDSIKDQGTQSLFPLNRIYNWPEFIFYMG